MFYDVIEKVCVMKHLDIKENEYINSKSAKNYFWPNPFGFPMYEPYNTGPMSAPVLSPVGPPIMPRRNPYYPKPTNPFLNPYNAQYRQMMWPVAQVMPRNMGPCPHHGTFCPTPRSSGIYGPPRGPMGPLGPINPMSPEPRRPRGPMGPLGPINPMSGPPRGPMGPFGPVGMPPIGPNPYSF